MGKELLQKSLTLLLKRQTNILSAAFVIMTTVILSQVLGLVRQRLLVAIFGASDTLGVYLASVRLPDFLFQLIIAGALSSAFIPVFSEFLAKGKEKEGQQMASTLLSFGLILFFILALILFLFAPFFLQILNLGSGFSPQQMELMAALMRITIIAQLLFIIGTFFTALLQSYNHFFIPGFAAASYNLGIIIGIMTLSSTFGIYAPAFGMILGAILFILLQIPLVKRLGFSFRPKLSLSTPGVKAIGTLMWPRTLSIGVFQLGTLGTVMLVSFLSSAGRNYVILDYAQTLAFAPVALVGQAIAQAAFPVLSRERERLAEFKATLVTSFNQMLYLVLPIAVLLIVLRIPIVRLIYGAGEFDWAATVLTGKMLALFSVAIFAQALTYLISRGFYALHDTKTPLVVGTCTTLFMLLLGGIMVMHFHFGIESIAIAYSLASILNFLVLTIFLDRRTQGFQRSTLFYPAGKIFLASFFTGIALYVPIKLLDQLVFDTTKTFNLLLLTGISSFFGLSLYLFLTWAFKVKEAKMFITIFKRIGDWREILGKSHEVVIDRSRLNS